MLHLAVSSRQLPAVWSLCSQVMVCGGEAKAKRHSFSQQVSCMLCSTLDTSFKPRPPQAAVLLIRQSLVAVSTATDNGQ